MLKNLSYKQAIIILREKHSGIKTAAEYISAYESVGLSSGLPDYPPREYADQWTGWSTFLDNGRTPRGYFDIESAAQAMRKLGLRTSRQFFQYIKENNLPEGCPRSPTVVYKKEFAKKGGWKWYLGSEMMSYVKAEEYIRGVTPRITTFSDFRSWADSDKKPSTFPNQPHSFSKYKDYWVSYPAFFGVADAKPKKGKDRDLRQAMKVVASLIRQFPEIKDHLNDLID